jgi:cytoskeleton protein RodZ
MLKVGAYLKEVRESRKLSLHEVGMALKINPKMLQAIEDGEPQKLPAKTFLRGFIRSYAQYLKLEVDSVMQMFQEEQGSTKPQPKIIPSMNSPAVPNEDTNTSSFVNPASDSSEPITGAVAGVSKEERSHFKSPTAPAPVTQSQIIYGLVSIVLLALIFVAYRLIDKYQQETALPNSPLPPPIERSDSEGSITASPVTESPQPPMTPPPISTSDSSVGPSPVSAPVPATAPTVAVPVPAPAPATAPAPLPSAPVPTPSAAIPKPAVTPTTPTSSAPLPAAANPSPAVTNEVIVEALNKVKIRYAIGAAEAKSIDLEAGQFHTFKSKVPLKLDINDGGSVNLFVNGRDRGIPGQIGKPVTLNYGQ